MNKLSTNHRRAALAAALTLGAFNVSSGPLESLNALPPESRTAARLTSAMNELDSEFRAIMNVSAGDRTPEQKNRASEIVEQVRELSDERASVRMGNALNRRPVEEALANQGRSTRWRDSAGRDVRVLGPAENVATHQRNSSDDTQSGSPLSVGGFVRGIVTNDWNGYDRERELLNLSSTVGGGVMIPETIGTQVIDLARAGSAVIAAGAQTIPMTSPKMSLVKITGDPAVEAVAENGEIAESDPGIGGIVFEARKQAALVRVSRELLFDSPNAAQIVEGVLSAAMGARIDKAALDGDGTGANPTGLLSIAGVNDVAVGGAPSWDDWVDGVQAVEQANGMPTATVMSPAVKSHLNKLKNNQGDYLQPPAMLSELAKHTSTKMADHTATIGDFSQLMIGVWRDVELSFSGFAKDAFEKDQVLFRVIWRGDVAAVRPNHFSKLTGISLA